MDSAKKAMKKNPDSLLENGTRVSWQTRDGSTETGTIVDFLPVSKNPHLVHDSYLLEMDFNGDVVAVATWAKLEVLGGILG